MFTAQTPNPVCLTSSGCLVHKTFALSYRWFLGEAHMHINAPPGPGPRNGLQVCLLIGTHIAFGAGCVDMLERTLLLCSHCQAELRFRVSDPRCSPPKTHLEMGVIGRSPEAPCGSIQMGLSVSAWPLAVSPEKHGDFQWGDHQTPGFPGKK